MSEASGYFQGKGSVQAALTHITTSLRQLGIDYAVVGGMALFHYGYRLFTEDVVILVTREGLQEIHIRLEGLGYVAPFAGSQNLRDASSGVRIEFLLAGAYPGDGKPKPVSFPDPAEAAVEHDGIRYVALEKSRRIEACLGHEQPRSVTRPCRRAGADQDAAIACRLWENAQSFRSGEI